MPSLRWLIRHGAVETAQGIKLVVGLGNPGSRYVTNRHNAGFMVVERFAHAHSLHFSRKKFNALIAEGRLEGKRLILAQPQTFMNASGEAVAKLYRFYKIAPADLLVVYDDLDLPLGKIRLRAEGSAGGHHGMESIIARIGTISFARLRIGIGRPNPEADIDHVLGAFEPQEQPEIERAFEQAVDSIDAWISQGIDVAMNRFN